MSEPTRTLLVAARNEAWNDVVERLSGDAISFEFVDPSIGPAKVAAMTQPGDRPVIVDLSAGLSRGLETIAACRRATASTPIVAVAENPSVDLARSIRASGVFYLALLPVTAEELRTVLEDALRSIGRKKPSTSTCTTRKRVLVVDDDADYRASMTALLEGEGYTVQCAASAKEGLQRLEADRPDLVVLDVMMEDTWAGYGLNQAVKFGDKRDVAAGVPILMVSSVEKPPGELFPTAAETSMVTPDDYLTKPLDIPVFLEHVRELIGRAGRTSS